MALTPFVFNPVQGYRDPSFAPTDPASESAFRDVMQDIPDQLRDSLNDAINKLSSTVDGSSGADNVGATPVSGGTANTVQGVLEEIVAIDGNNVKLTGNQTVAGVKTFSSSPIVPTPTTSTQASTKGYVDTSIGTVVLGQIPDDSLTEAKMANAMKKISGGVAPYDDVIFESIVTAANDFIVGTGNATVAKKTLAETKTILGLDAEYAKFKSGNSTFTDNDTSQTFTDDFCTSTSLVTVAITSVTAPQGTWKVESGTGNFTITSTVAETNDITFDYYIQKEVGQ